MASGCRSDCGRLLYGGYIMSFSAGIIGAGGIAGMGIFGLHDPAVIGKEKIRASHAGGYESTDSIDLVAIADLDEERLDRFGEAWEIPPERRYIGHERMLESESLDVVSVCTPTDLHHLHVIDAAESPAAPDVIWCEKPIDARVSDARRMIDACHETETELVINHSFRFTEKLQQLRTLIRDEDLIGEIQGVTGQFRMELLRNSTHLIDMIFYLIDAHPQRVSGYINGENEVVDGLDIDVDVDDAGGGGFLVLDDGTFVSIDCTVPRASSSMMLQLIGSTGKVYLNNDDGEWRYWELADGTHVERSLPGIEGSWSWDVDYEQAFPNAAHHIEALLRGNTENQSSGDEALRSLEVIIGMYASHHAGGHVALPLARPFEDIRITSW